MSGSRGPPLSGGTLTDAYTTVFGWVAFPGPVRHAPSISTPVRSLIGVRQTSATRRPLGTSLTYLRSEVVDPLRWSIPH